MGLNSLDLKTLTLFLNGFFVLIRNIYVIKYFQSLTSKPFENIMKMFLECAT